jgi:hypothetical protein
MRYAGAPGVRNTDAEPRTVKAAFPVMVQVSSNNLL